MPNYRCKEKDNLVYSVSNGGLICRKHLQEHSDAYDEDVYSVLKVLYFMDIDHYIDLNVSHNLRIMIRHIIDTTYEEFVSFKTKSRSILKQIKKY